MKNLAHSASFHSMENSAPSKPGIKHLAGRLDLAGTDAVGLKFNAIAGSNRGLITDVSGVTFLSSLGIRMLLTGAKLMQRRGGAMVLLSRQPQVYEVLEVSGVLDLLTVVNDSAEAMLAIGA